MKKNKKKDFIEALKMTPIILSVCEKIGIARNTVYRWKEEDPEFRAEMNKALKIGVGSINELAESKLIKAIQREEFPAIKYWLDNNKKNYIRPRPKDFFERLYPKDKISKITVEIVEPSTDQEKIVPIERKEPNSQ
jgi:hypothetical protein